MKMPPCKNYSSGSNCCGAAAAVKPNATTDSSLPGNLKVAVQSSIASFLSTRLSSNGDIAQDVYRALRDEAHLLLERQLISDALDLDPFDLMRVSSSGDGGGVGDRVRDEEDLLDKKKNREMIERFKNLMSVISCERTTTVEGYSSILAIVQLKNDGMMSGVDDNVRLYFTFVREPQHGNTNANTDDEGSKRGAIPRVDVEGNNDDIDLDYHNQLDDESSYYSDDSGKRKRKNIKVNRKRRTWTKQQDETDYDDDDDDNHDDKASKDTGNNDHDKFTPKTIVTYKIDMSVDHGQKETLLGVDIYALGEHPSVEEAVPMMCYDDEEDGNEERHMNRMADDDDDDDEGNNADDGCHDTEELTSKFRSRGQSLSKYDDEFEEIEVTDSDNLKGETGEGDRFAVVVHPQRFVAFLDRVNMNLNERSVIYFLLTFPLYEHEWDISSFVLSSTLDGGSVDDEADEEE